jgi:bifunctional non-homologous end joining protein LigD
MPLRESAGKHAGRWRQGLTAEKDAGLPVAGAGAGGAVEFEEWTQDAHLRHSRFVGLREDRSAKEVRRE